MGWLRREASVDNENLLYFPDIMVNATAGHPALLELIFDRLQSAPYQRITFADFMNLALYAPGLGYYERSAKRIGPEGDFFTSSQLSPDFGEVLALQIAEMWDGLGQPQPFTVVEMGAGRGQLARDILAYWQSHRSDLLAVLDYQILETATAMKAEQQQVLANWPVRWVSWAELPDKGVQGCFFSNELIDALPVHQVVVEKGELREVYVTAREGKITEVVGSLSTPALRNYFQAAEIDILSYAEGYRTEVNLGAIDWLGQVSQKLQRGYLLSIDYGYSAQRYYNPMRSQGTLQCYYQHRYHNDPYIYIGEQDITAHVDFSTLQRVGESLGLEFLGLTKQGLFLMAWGWGDRLSRLTQEHTDPMAILARRQQLQQAIDPTGLGGFGVLLQSRAVDRVILTGWQKSF
jgi:SAM-dependent MidA family methyltransferase